MVEGLKQSGELKLSVRSRKMTWRNGLRKSGSKRKVVWILLVSYDGIMSGLDGHYGVSIPDSTVIGSFFRGRGHAIRG